MAFAISDGTPPLMALIFIHFFVLMFFSFAIEFIINVHNIKPKLCAKPILTVRE